MNCNNRITCNIYVVSLYKLHVVCETLCVSLSQDANTKDGKVGKEPETKKPKKPTIRQVDLPIDEETPSLRKTQLTKANEAEVCYTCLCVALTIMCSEVHRYIQLVFSVYYPPPPPPHTHPPGKHELPGPA